MIKSQGYAALSGDQPLQPFEFERRPLSVGDVKIDILYCGVCHSDLHTARNDWGNTLFPSVPGHEIVGRVSAIGASVDKFKIGDMVGVGCMVDSCQTCPSCVEDLEQFCDNGFTGTYNGHAFGFGENTYGGYADNIVVRQEFVLRIPETDTPAAIAPRRCAGITTYSPLRHWNVGPGQKVGVVGLGGLGHMGIKIARAMGAEVVLITTSPGKREDGLRLGAQEVIISTDPKQMAAAMNSLDFILNTVAAPHDLNALISLLKRDGTMTLVGAPAEPHPSPEVFRLIFKRRKLAGSLIGGIAETQEMLDFCAEHNIVSDIEMIPIQQINEAYERMLKGDVRYRFVIDMESLKG